MSNLAIAIVSFITIYACVAFTFLMLFMNGYLKLEMKSKKDRKGTEEYRHIHLFILPLLAISSILTNRKSNKRRYVDDTERI